MIQFALNLCTACQHFGLGAPKDNQDLGFRIITNPIQRPTPHPSKEFRMSDTASPPTPSLPTLPDRLSVDPRSPHHVAAVFEHDIGIRLNGKDRNDVEEYCISEGWIKVPAGKTRDRSGRPLLIKIKGAVEAFYR